MSTTPRECKFCGKTYHKPCDGDDAKCANRLFAAEQAQKSDRTVKDEK